MAQRSLGKSILVWAGRVALGVVAFVVVVLLVGSVWEQVERRQTRHDYPMVGKLVDVGGGRRIHIDCRGQGSPTVVLEAGLDTNGVWAWSAVHDEIAKVTRTCAYDRAGVVWSDPKSGVHDADGVADDLHAALAGAGEQAPFVLVGHSLGGPYISDYTRKFPDQVAGLVFVDASHPDQFKRLREAKIPGADRPGLPLILTVLVNLDWSGLPRLALNTQAGQPHVPAKANAAMRAFGAPGLRAAYDEALAIEATCTEAAKLGELGKPRLGDRPLVVLTAAKTPPAATLKGAGMTPSDFDRMRRIWITLHDDEATWSTHSRHQIVPDSTHYIQFDRPDVVIAAVTEVVGEVRAEGKQASAKR